MAGKQYFGGMPIRPDVDRLMQEIKPQPGDIYRHEDLARIIDVKQQSNRYRAVIYSWRRRLLREYNIDIEAVVGIGYRILDDNDRVSVGVKDFTASVRQMGRSSERIARADTDKLDEMHRGQQDHAVRLTQELVSSGRNAAKQIALSGRVVTLPRKIA